MSFQCTDIWLIHPPPPPTHPIPPNFFHRWGEICLRPQNHWWKEPGAGGKKMQPSFCSWYLPMGNYGICLHHVLTFQPFIVFQYTEHKWMILKMKQTTGEITKSIKFLRTVLWVADYTMQVVFKINTTRHKTSLCVQFSWKPIQQISVGGFVTSFQEAKTCKHFQGDKLEAVALAWPTMYWLIIKHFS